MDRSGKTEKQKKQLFLADVPSILARPLSACFEKEGWRVASLGAAETDVAHHLYAADVMSKEAEEIFALEDISVLVAPLEAERADGITRLECLLALAKQQAHLEHVLLLGREDVFAGKGVAGEETDWSPDTATGKRRARLEALALAWKTEGMPVTVVRLPELCGEGATEREGFLGAFVAAALDEKEVTAQKEQKVQKEQNKQQKQKAWTVRVHGPQEFLVARDAAYGLWRAVERDFSDDVLHLGGGQGFGFETLVSEVRAEMPEGTKLPQAAQARGTEGVLPFGHPFLDSTRARQELGWQPRCDIRAGIRASVKSIVDARAAERAQAMESAKKRVKRAWHRAVPYLENLAGAAIMAGIAYL